MTPQKRERIVNKIKTAQEKAGLRPEPGSIESSAIRETQPRQALATEPSIASWLSNGAATLWSSVCEVMPSMPSLLPGADAADASPKQDVKNGDVLIVRREGWGLEAFGDNARSGLSKIYPEERIHEVEVHRGCGYAFPRNLMQAGPEGMLLTATPPEKYGNPERLDCLRRALKAFLETNQLAYRELKTFVNMANVAWYPDKDLLIVNSMPDSTIKYLVGEVYDRPGHVLIADTDYESSDGHPVRGLSGFNACYDLDLAFFAIAVPDAENPGAQTWVALVHEPCFSRGTLLVDDKLNPINDLNAKQPSFSETLTSLGFKVIPLPREDVVRLGANAIASTRDPGTALMSDPGISKYLVRRLKEAGVDVRLPDKTLGTKGEQGDVPFGIHCLTVELFRPDETEKLAADTPQAPEKDEV